MRKIAIMMLVFASIIPLSVSAQWLVQVPAKVSAMEQILTEKKKSRFQVQLSGARACGGVLDCNDELRSETSATSDPCLYDRLACHEVSFSRSDTGQAWLLGGLKLRAEVGHMTFSVGRHKDNVILTRAPFVEGAYLLGYRTSVSFGVLQTKVETGSKDLWYVMYRTAF